MTGDRDLLDELSRHAAGVKPENDPKLAALVEELARIAREAEKEGVDEADRRRKRKVLVFSYYEDTIDYAEEYLRKVIGTDKRLAAYRGRVRLGRRQGIAPRRQPRRRGPRLRARVVRRRRQSRARIENGLICFFRRTYWPRA